MKNFIFAALCSVVSIATQANAYAAAAQPAGLDFSRNGYGFSSVSPVEFLRNELQIPLAEGEEEYLAAFPDNSIKYSDNIPGKCVAVDAPAGSNNITVTAQNYEYTAANGQSVVWVPQSAEGKISTGGVWNFAADGLQNDYITVTYSTSLNIGNAYVEGILNQYYSAARSSAEKLRLKSEEYKNASNRFNADCLEYQKYLGELEEYAKQSTEYENYLKEFAEWKRQNDPYEAYLAEYQKYLDELEAYNSYNDDEAWQKYLNDQQRYFEYMAELENYREQYQAYLKSLDTPEIAKVKAQVGVLDYIYTVAGNKRTIYGAVMGETVTQVLANKEELKLLGADSQAVDIAGRATKNLRNLFENYKKLTAEEDKYIFYCTTYESFNENLCELLRALDYFYRIDVIRNYIAKSGKETNYCILLAQLYEITDSLNVKAVTNYEAQHGWNRPTASSFDENYKIGGQTSGQILGASTLEYSGDPLPLEGGYPAMPQEPVKPEEVLPPKFYERPSMPVAPEPVQNPGEPPKEVPRPVKPQEVLQPTPPVEYVPTEWETKLSAMDGKLERRSYSGDYVLTLTAEVKKYFRNFEHAPIVTVYFYPERGAEQDEYLYFEESIDGSYIVYPPDAVQPQKTRRGYICTFSGWEYFDGTPVDFANLPTGVGDLYVYPSFTETPLTYDVIWVIDGVEYRQKCAYDDYPKPPENPQKPAQGLRQYYFVGWDRDIERMTDSTVTYYAQFKPGYLITWKAEGSPNVITSVRPGDIPKYEGTPQRQADLMYTYTFSRWDKTPVPAQKDETYTAVFVSNYIVPLNGRGASININGGFYEANCRSIGSAAVHADRLLDIAVTQGLGIKINWGNYSLSFTSAETYGLREAGTVNIKPGVFQIGGNGYRCYVTFTDGSGDAVNYSGTLSISFSGSFDTEHSRLFCVNGDNAGAEVRFTFNNGNAEFLMHGDCTYELYPMYGVSIAPSEAAVTVSTTLAKRNEKVTVYVNDLPQGRYLSAIYVVDSLGNTVSLAADNSFVMPAGEVSVGVGLGYTQYTVTFQSEGKIISRKEYRWGDKVVPPANPVKAPDGQNSYVFAGWDAEIAEVTGNATYNAIYNALPLPEFANENGGLSKTVIIIICVSVGVFVLLVGGTVTAVILIKRRKKRKNNKIA